MFRNLKDAVAIVRSGIVDREYYEALTGHRFPTVLAAAQHFLAAPERAELSLHPLFEPRFLEPKPSPELVLNYLRHPARYQAQSPHPCFDLKAAKKALRANGVAFPDGAWLAWTRTATPDTLVPVPAGATPVRWGELRAALIRAAQQWRADAALPSLDWAAAAQRPRSAGRTSIIVPIVGSLKTSLRRLSLLKGNDERELVCTGFTSRAQFSSFSALAQVRSLILVPAIGRSLAQQWNAGASASSGDRLVFLAANATMSAEAIPELLAPLADPGVAIAQPLNETPAMLVHSAGAYFADGDAVPSALFSEHPVTDAEMLGTTAIPATYSAAVALRSEWFFALGGFDERYANDFADVDLSLRMTTAGAGKAVLVPAARVVVQPPSKAFPTDPSASATLLRANHAAPPTDAGVRLRAAGFEVGGHRQRPLAATEPAAGVASVLAPVLRRPSTGIAALPRLRWTIDTPVTAGWWAQIWGDWHFANSLARALRRLGQQVAVDTKQARGRETRRFDDVLLTLRGLDEVTPAPGRVNLMWVISHPDQVTAAEAAGYDQVFAASTRWAADRTQEWGQLIEPLLQCTDAEWFHPGRAQRPSDDRAVFVGNLRPDRTRPIVDAAIAAGIGLDLYGTGWEDTPSGAHVVGRRVPNEDLGQLYAEAGVVLNDHWPDMRRLGFISNRLFDAVACGARVLSDSVTGADAIFGDAVRFCDTADEASEILRRSLDEHWPDRETRLAIAERVRTEHSFDRRAEALVRAASRIVAER